MRTGVLYVFVMLALPGCQDRNPTPKPAAVPATPIKAADLTAPVSGSIKARPFIPDKVTYEGGKLSFRAGKEFFADMEIAFDLPKVDSRKLEGMEWKLGSTDFGHPTIQVATKEGQALPNTEFVFASDYLMTLKITKQTPTSLNGTIDLRFTKLGSSRLGGTFMATIKKTTADPLDAGDAPYIEGKITIVGPYQKERLAAGFVGKGTDGKNQSNSAGTTFAPDGKGWVTSTTFAPQLTSCFGHPTDGLRYRHVKVAPGNHVVWVSRNGVVAAWEKVIVKAEDQLNVDLTIDPAKMGSVVVTLPDEEAKEANAPHLALVPFDFDRGDAWLRNAFVAAEVKKGTKNVALAGVPAGKYWAMRGRSEAEVAVTAGQESAVTLVRGEAKK